MNLKKKKMTLAHALILALIATIIFSGLQLFGVIDLYLLGYNISSWVGYLILSIFIAWCFNKQPSIIKMLIAIIIIVCLLIVYAIIANRVPNNIPYINALGIGIFSSFLVCLVYACFASKQDHVENSQKSKPEDPAYLIQAIYNGRYATRNDLYRFYTNYTSKKDTFIDLLNVICDVCLESANNEGLSSIVKERCNKVYSLVRPILDEEKEVDYLMNVCGKERDSLLTLYKFSNMLEQHNRELAIQHISLIADYVVASQEKLADENRRNTQSLTISIVGILLTIVFSLLSFLATNDYYALHKYMECIK